ncbi:MAG: cytochrome c3 family protein, partial [bacterium]
MTITNMLKKSLIFFTTLSLFFVLAEKSWGKRPHTDISTYAGQNLAGACAACHIPHGAESDRLWPVPLTDTSGVSLIQNLCMYCHWQKGYSTVPDPAGFYLGKYKAHILVNAHGQNGLLYEDTGEKRHGPGHLYRNNCMTRYGEYVTGYVALGYPSFESIACYADPDTTSDDRNILPRLSCTSCHDPHAEYIDDYEDRDGAVETYDGIADNYILNVVGDGDLLSTTYYTDWTNDKPIGRTRRICLACHYGGEEPDSSGEYGPLTEPDATKIDNLIPPYPTTSVAAHYDGVSKCTGCHPWDWPPANCTSCHGIPPSTISDRHYPADYNTLTFQAFTTAGVGVHDT